MINGLHLLWIVPLSGAIGYTLAALMVAAKNGDKHIS